MMRGKREKLTLFRGAQLGFEEAITHGTTLKSTGKWEQSPNLAQERRKVGKTDEWVTN